MGNLLRKLFSLFTGPVPMSAGLSRRDLGLEIVTAGDPSHKHDFTRVEWDNVRFGSDFVDPDPDPGTPIAFTMATYKYLFRCGCGAEGVNSVRALI